MQLGKRVPFDLEAEMECVDVSVFLTHRNNVVVAFVLFALQEVLTEK